MPRTTAGTRTTASNRFLTRNFPYAGSFNGANNNVSINVTNLRSPTTQITLSTWIYPQSATSQYGIFNRDNWATAGKNAWILYYNAATNTVAGGISQGTSQLVSSGRIVANQWTYVTMTYDGTSILLYINGVVAGTTIQSGVTFDATTSMTLGAISFKGYTADMRIYDAALTQDQINQIYLQGTDPSPSNNVGWWKLDEGTGTVVNDSSGFANTGTYNGTVGQDSQWRGGNTPMRSPLLVRDFGYCGSFDGATTSFRANAGTILSLATDYSFAFWFKAPAYQSINFARLIQATGVQVYFNGTTSVAYLYGHIGGTTDNTLGSVNDRILNSRWTHIVISVNAAGAQKCYFNAGISYNRALTDHTNLTITDLYIGVSPTNTNHLLANIDDFRIYNIELTQDQINQIYFEGVDPAPANNRAWWKFDEGSGTSVADSSGNGNVGVITSGAFSTDVVMKTRSGV